MFVEGPTFRKIQAKSEFEKAHPFLRWAGSKNWLIKKGIDRFIPPSINNYHEPFLGCGAIYFYLSPNKISFLSDLNSELINTYIEIRDNVESVIKFLYNFQNTEYDYYLIRNKEYKKKYQNAAKFIFLNKTSFNGIYRVNSKGEYNVPYGFRTKVDFINENKLRKVSLALQNTHLNVNDFSTTLENIKRDDFVFIDPPYTVMHQNNGFIEYNKKIFSWQDQERLSEFVNRINQIGAFYTLTNAAHKSIYDLYRPYGVIEEVHRMSTIGGKYAKRQIISEYIIKNF